VAISVGLPASGLCPSVTLQSASEKDRSEANLIDTTSRHVVRAGDTAAVRSPSDRDREDGVSPSIVGQPTEFDRMLGKPGALDRFA
jgi:hypothetical protein